MPYKTATGRTYDVGDFEGALRACLAKADYAGFAGRAAESKSRGLIRGVGLSSYIECTAFGEGETGSVMLEKSGDFTVLIGTQSTGQGHETAYAQVVSEYLDVPLSRIKVVQGDTDRVASGGGTGGSRSIPIGAVMLDRATRKLTASLKDLAADELEAAPHDLEIVDGRIRIAGTDRSISYEELAALPAATAEKRTAIESFTPPVATYPNGTHVCEVEIDPDTGRTRIARYVVVDDFGLTLNPLLLEGQVHGGIAQGVGQALMEGAVYDAEGQLLTASLMDYTLPRADDLPNFAFETRNVPSTTNPMGLKGAGEAGTIGSTPAVMNAVADALWRAYGIDHIDMPATPFAVFRAIREARWLSSLLLSFPRPPGGSRLRSRRAAPASLVSPTSSSPVAIRYDRCAQKSGHSEDRHGRRRGRRPRRGARCCAGRKALSAAPIANFRTSKRARSYS